MLRRAALGGFRAISDPIQRIALYSSDFGPIAEEYRTNDRDSVLKAPNFQWLGTYHKTRSVGGVIQFGRNLL
jgi:hypothetical protein